MSMMLTKEKFINTKWDASEWTREMKTQWQEKMFELGFSWMQGNTLQVQYLHKSFYYLGGDSSLCYGSLREFFTPVPGGNKLYTDVFPEKGTLQGALSLLEEIDSVLLTSEDYTPELAIKVLRFIKDNK